ncbi:alkaline phosphatase D family protein [Roseomonas sp. OT10]|uniref:alkaline phosphatase D family protein n=1 Tax=Roseomonas cutis TaxID=2897332 RepID=UPI001E5A458B|nr:alkaline phosphatase D family protein [Roseomonas sp. OT10]UFN47339.1 alkaline phosphatase D family protein [Roseomonas sp. OT10]
MTLTGGLRALAAGLPGDPFTLGVASGEPGPDAVVLWTRLAPAPRQPDGGMPPEPVAVDWVVAEDAALRRVVRSGQALAVPEDAHSVHLELSGLRPGRPYWYRFTALGAESPLGRTRTAPAPGAMPAALRLAVASCQQYEHGFYGAYRHMRAEEPDAVIFLGDYIYEASWGRRLVRSHDAPTARDLAGYRARYALYKSDPDLQAMHAACPWLVTWDDHEVSNDYADDRGETERGAPFLERRAAAYRAFWEHMPLPEAARPRGASAQVYRCGGFGALASIHLLDDRQYRAHQACQRPDRGGAGRVTRSACPELDDPARSLLGQAQEDWLAAGLRADGPRWTLLAQQTRMARLGSRPRGMGPEAEPAYWTDGWDGYAPARRRLLGALAERRAPNPIVLGGDIHAHLVAELRPDFDRPETPPVAVEFTGTSITSQGSHYPDRFPDEPHIAYANGDRRGYVSLLLTPDRAEASLRTLDDPADPATGMQTARRFVVEAGRPGLLPG